MDNSLTLSPELAASLKNCKVGETEKITLEITPTQNDESGFTAEVVSAEYEGAEDEAEEKAPPKPPGKGKHPNPAIAIVLGGKPGEE